MRKTSEILADALAKFEDGKRWIQGTLFWPLGQPVPADQQGHIRKRALESDSFCSLGAIYKSMAEHGEITPEDSGFTVLDKVNPLVRGMGNGSAPYYYSNCGAVAGTNDNAKSFDEVKAMFCTGIKNALAEEEKEDADE